MKKINISIIKPDNYIHSFAFLELGELIYFSCKELGFDAQLTWNKIYADNKNIIIGAHLLNTKFINQIPKSSIILNTEQIYDDQTSWNKNIFFWAENLEIWDYSKKNIEKWIKLGFDKVKHFEIGCQKELSRLNKLRNKDIDILFYGSINERRKKILDELKKNGLKIKILFGVYGKERDSWIERSKIVLNNHYYNSQIFEIVRVFYLMINSVAVVGEVNETTYIDPIYAEGIHPAKYNELVINCIEIINNNSMRDKLEKKAYETISKYPQKIFTKKILDL